jgi:twitching motility protein PilT
VIDVFGLIVEAQKRKGSDLLMTVDSPPAIRVRGALEPVGETPLAPEDTISALKQLAHTWDLENFQQDLELDFGFTIPGVTRLRCNAARQQGVISLAIRLLPLKVPSIEELELPQVCADLINKRRGLIIVSGSTGSGKTTTLAAMVQHLNMTRPKHVITIEDPIEYIYKPRKCMITQRELGTDTCSFPEALKHVLRQNPDVILVGEMRDTDTAEAVLTIADTGHLVLSTSHAPTSHQALERIVDLFPPAERHFAYSGLASLLVGVLCQSLVPRASGDGLIAAVEIMLANTAVRNLIREEKLYQLPSVVQTSRGEGMMTLNESLVQLYRAEKIALESVYEFCNDVYEVERLLGSRPHGAHLTANVHDTTAILS